MLIRFINLGLFIVLANKVHTGHELLCVSLNTGLYITFSIWGGNGRPGAVHSRGVWGFPQEFLMILGVLSCILVHSEAYREAHRAS